jgi:hypothetical protein
MGKIQRHFLYSSLILGSVTPSVLTTVSVSNVHIYIYICALHIYKYIPINLIENLLRLFLSEGNIVVIPLREVLTVKNEP